MLVNATPVRAADDEIGSVVVTVHDLAPSDEIGRLRTELPGPVSHELREPLIAVKAQTAGGGGSARPGPRCASSTSHRRLRPGTRGGRLGDLLDAGRINSGTLSVAPEPWELAGLVERARSSFLGGCGRRTVLVDSPANLPSVMPNRRPIVQGSTTRCPGLDVVLLSLGTPRYGPVHVRVRPKPS